MTPQSSVLLTLVLKTSNRQDTANLAGVQGPLSFGDSCCIAARVLSKCLDRLHNHVSTVVCVANTGIRKAGAPICIS
jgi:hypothetical protein